MLQFKKIVDIVQQCLWPKWQLWWLNEKKEKFKPSLVFVCVCWSKLSGEASSPAAIQLLEHLNQPPVTLLHCKCIHSPSFHTIMHFTEELAFAATVEEIHGI